MLSDAAADESLSVHEMASEVKRIIEIRAAVLDFMVWIIQKF